jgi:hypothetical protein
MSSKRKSHKASNKPSKSVARKPAAMAKQVRAKARASKQVGTTLNALPSRATRFVKSHPVRVLLGAAAMGLAVAKLKSIV